MILNEKEQDLIQILLNNEQLLGIVKKVFNEMARAYLPVIEKGDTDYTLGQKYRAYQTAQELTQLSFKEMERYQKREDKEQNKKIRAR